MENDEKWLKMRDVVKSLDCVKSYDFKSILSLTFADLNNWSIKFREFN